jgi:hypothetical protein
MKKLRQLLVMLLLMVSGNISALYQWYDYSEPFILSSDPLSSYQAIGGVHLDPSITTLVIPNKIDGRIVGNVVPRYYTYLSKFRYESWGNYYSKNVKFSPFERSCNMRVDDDYGNEYRRFDLLPRVNNNVYDYGVEPVFDKTELLGEPLYIEEIVFPSMMENFFSEPIVKGLTSLKRLYMRRTGWIVNFGIDLTGCTNMEEIHLMCDVPHYVVDDSKIPHKINLYVPQKYYNNYMADPDWANSPSFNILPEPTNGATLKIKNTYPGLLVTIDGINIYGNDSPGYVSTMNFGKYYMPRYKVSYGGVGAIKVTLNGQSLDDFENEDALLDMVPGENILELELVNSSEVTLNSNGNGSTVKWNGRQVIGNAGGTYKLEDVKSDASNTLVVNYAPGTQELTVKKGSTTLTPTSNSGGTATFEIGKVMTDCNIDVQVKDKLCNITVNKTTVDGDLKVVRSVDGKAYFTYLTDGVTFPAGRGTTISFNVPNTTILTTAQLGGVNMTKTTNSSGVSTYTATVPSSTAATLRLVGQHVTSSQPEYCLQTVTKIGNGTVNYHSWYADERDEKREAIGELTTPVSSIITLLGDDENEYGWTLTIKPDPGYDLTTFYGTWLTGDDVPESFNMLSEPAYFDNATGTTYHDHNGPTAGQKRAAGGDFSLDLEAGRTISYDADTHTYTFTVEGMNWQGTSMAITIGFSDPNESSKKQMSVVAVGTPTDGKLMLEYRRPSDTSLQRETLLTSTGSTTKEYQPGDYNYIYFYLLYEKGHIIEDSGEQVTIPFTVYHNGVDATSLFEYEDGDIYGRFTNIPMEGNWTFVFPDGNQATDAKWSFLKSGEGSLSCEIVPTGTSVEPTTRIIGNSSEILRLQKDEVQSVIVKVQTADGNTFKAFCNGNDVTSNFTLSGSEYTLTTNQADLKDANWTVLFTEGQAANTFTYQFSQTTGGEVLVGVVPVGDTSADIKSIQEGSMTLSLTSDEAQGVILFVEPEDNMAVRIYSGETDVTSQFTYDSSSNSYMRQTTSLANETLLFVFADKNELGVANPNLLTQHIQLTGEQLGNVWMQYLDSDGADYDDAYAGNEHPYVTFTSEDKIYIKGAKPCITVPNGYTFKAYFNGQEVTDFTLENNYYVATLDESFVTDGTWVVEFKEAEGITWSGMITGDTGEDFCMFQVMLNNNAIDYNISAMEGCPYDTFKKQFVGNASELFIDFIAKDGYDLKLSFNGTEFPYEFTKELYDEEESLYDYRFRTTDADLIAPFLVEGTWVLTYKKVAEAGITWDGLIIGDVPQGATVDIGLADIDMKMEVFLNAEETSASDSYAGSTERIDMSAVITAPAGYNFKVWFNGEEKTDRFDENGVYNITSGYEEALAPYLQDGQWIVLFYDDLERYDLNHDKKVDIADVTTMVNKVLENDQPSSNP